MNAEVKAKWLEALSSGKFQQGTGYLKRNTNEGPQYCCLGVLCEITHPDKFTLRSEWRNIYDYGDHSFLSDITLPLNLQDEVGLDGPKCDELAEMNDAGKSFEFIADYIERTL